MKNKKMMVAVGCTALAVILLICVIAWRAGGDKPVDPTDGTTQGTAGSSGDETTESTALESGLGESYFPEDTQIPTDTWPDDVTPPNNEPTKPSTEGTDPATDPSGESTTPSNEPSAPVTEPSEPATEPTEPATEPTEPVHTHSYVSEVVEPICYEVGYTVHTCECGDTYRDNYVDELGHDWTEWETVKEPAGDDPGTKKRSCKVCGMVVTQDIEKHEHSYTAEVIEVTCLDYGMTVYTCDCGYSYTGDYIMYPGHDWSEWETTKEATTEATGERVRCCDRCGEKATETIPALDAETGEAYESYIDPRITVRKNRTNTSYKYLDYGVAVNDFRTWGDPPSIWVNDDGTLTVVYYDQNGTRIEFKTEVPPEDYINSYVILDDGTYDSDLIGGYNK